MFAWLTSQRSTICHGCKATVRRRDCCKKGSCIFGVCGASLLFPRNPQIRLTEAQPSWSFVSVARMVVAAIWAHERSLGTFLADLSLPSRLLGDGCIVKRMPMVLWSACRWFTGTGLCNALCCLRSKQPACQPTHRTFCRELAAPAFCASLLNSCPIGFVPFSFTFLLRPSPQPSFWHL